MTANRSRGRPSWRRRIAARTSPEMVAIVLIVILAGLAVLAWRTGFAASILPLS